MNDSENALHHLYDQLSTERYKASDSYTTAIDFVMSYPKVPTEFIGSVLVPKDHNFEIAILTQIGTNNT